MSYTVTRQIQWPEGAHVVEVSQGGIDYTNPDALVKRYSGEFETFTDPREAVETAINICKAWNKDGSKPRARVGMGATGGYTMPFEMSTFKAVRDLAKEIYSKLSKCPSCGAITEDLKEWWSAGEYLAGGEVWPFDDGEKYCSEACAEKASTYECDVCDEFVTYDEIKNHQHENDDVPMED